MLLQAGGGAGGVTEERCVRANRLVAYDLTAFCNHIGYRMPWKETPGAAICRKKSDFSENGERLRSRDV